ncbi:MAG: hypothetical protein QXI12_01230 [Candidatus Methanomethyliaceae archaeon]
MSSYPDTEMRLEFAALYYGPVKLPLLLRTFTVRKERFFAKKPKGKWYPVDRNAALQVDRNGLGYALGQFVPGL